MITYNVFFLTQDRSTKVWHPHLKEMEVAEPVANGTTNATPGFKDDPVVRGIQADLQNSWGTTVVVQSVVEL